jgi:type 1 fimbria pilin
MKKHNRILICALAALVSAAVLSGCGGGGSGISTVSGTVADINRDTITGATVRIGTIETESLASGVYRLNGVPSGWQTIRATAVIEDVTWVGSQAAEVLKNEPTFNVNIVLAPAGETTQIGGVVRDDLGHRVSGARVLLTTRILYPGEGTSSQDGPYSAIVAVTDSQGRYLMEDVPVGLSATIAASKVGFRNNEVEITTTDAGMIQDFDLQQSDLANGPEPPLLVAIESYTQPDGLLRSTDVDAYRAIKAFTSSRYRKAVSNKKTVLTRSAPSGSLIEVDLYWNALDLNDSRDIAGYGIYRTTSPGIEAKAIDFVRDPYASFYGDTGAEITPYQNYLYAVSTVDVEFLDVNNNPDPNAESLKSDFLQITPLGQLQVSYPFQGASVTGDPTFQWSFLTTDVDSFTVYLYDRFPTLPLDPSYDYGSDPILTWGAMPVWPRQSSPNESTVDGNANSIVYNGPSLSAGHTYYWVVLASKVYEAYDDGSAKRAAYSYSQIRNFTAR